MRMKKSLSVLVVAAFLALLLAVSAPSTFAESGHQVVDNSAPQNSFATMDQGCLGQLRSLIAQGLLAGQYGFVSRGFTGQVDPGAHYGTAGEAAFLEQVVGISPASLTSFCAGFSPQP